jgi:alginate O-acetyltransferase complex protein AlgI
VFLFIFLPLVYVLFLILPGIKAKNFMLMLASLLFYAFGEPMAIVLMLVSVAVNYFFGVGISKSTSDKTSKLLLVLAVTVNIGMLGVFKYTDFAVDLLNTVSSGSLPHVNIRLPIGISFFTFQALSYVIDVYKDRQRVQKNFFSLLLFVSFFPQLIAGPIIKYYDVALQIDNRSITLDKTMQGIRRFTVGLSKKLLIANAMGFAADGIFALGRDSLGTPNAWLGAVAYVFQIYFDFSAYSDMAIGLGKMFGFEFKENFNYPYAARSIKDFWRRWHISLSAWFKEYLYIPLGGNRKGKLRTNINKIIVFFFTGLWHGANITFVVWGLFHGLFLMLESFIPVKEGMKMPRFLRVPVTALQRLYTMLAVTAGFVIFRAETLSDGLYFLSKMFLFSDFRGFLISLGDDFPEFPYPYIRSFPFSLAAEYFTPLFTVIFIAAVIAALPVKNTVERLFRNRAKVYDTVTYVLTFPLLLLCIMNLSSASYNPFIYFRF